MNKEPCDCCCLDFPKLTLIKAGCCTYIICRTCISKVNICPACQQPYFFLPQNQSIPTLSIEISQKNALGEWHPHHYRVPSAVAQALEHLKVTNEAQAEEYELHKTVLLKKALKINKLERQNNELTKLVEDLTRERPPGSVPHLPVLCTSKFKSGAHKGEVCGRKNCGIHKIK
jgi:hypothetical protein